MGLHYRSKINYLLQCHLPGTLLVQAWLEKQGYNRQLIQKYVDSGWLKRLAHGAFARPNDPVSWGGAVYALQKELLLPVHVGGKTALQQQGHGHFVNIHEQGNTVFLYSHTSDNIKLRLPKWFMTHSWETPIHYLNTQLFSNNELGLIEKKQENKNFSLLLSSPERAIFELLQSIPEVQSLEEAYYFMESLTTLMPELVQSLLESCQSYKVKRLFLLLAEECQLPWFKYLKLEKIDLGKGKRKIGEGGKFYPKYNLSITKLPNDNSSSDIP